MTQAESFVVPPELRLPIDAYLDAVDLALLKSGASRVRRSGIVRDLEIQMLEMLRDRCAARAVTEADVAAVVRSMDAPEAYAQERSGAGAGPGTAAAVPEAPVQRRRRVLPSHARWGAALAVFGWVGLLMLAAVADEHGFRSVSDFVLLLVAGTPVVLIIGMATILGVSAWRQISADRERYWGRPVALLAIVALPLLLLCAAPVLFLALLLAAACVAAMRHFVDLKAATHRILASF